MWNSFREEQIEKLANISLLESKEEAQRALIATKMRIREESKRKVEGDANTVKDLPKEMGSQGEAV